MRLRGRLATLTVSASSSQRCERVQKRITSPTAIASATAGPMSRFQAGGAANSGAFGLVIGGHGDIHGKRASHMGPTHNRGQGARLPRAGAPHTPSVSQSGASVVGPDA